MCRREIKKTIPKSLWKFLEFTPETEKKERTLDFSDFDEFPPLN